MLILWLYIIASVAGVGAIGPYSNSSRSQVNNSIAPESCSGCTASVGVLDVKWNPGILYHTAATVIVTPDNVTNATRTSTVAAPSFVLPPNLGNAAIAVQGSVLSTDFAGTAYSLTYPTPISGLADVQVTSQFKEADYAGRITCVSAVTTLSYLFLSSPQGTGIAGVPQGCSVGVNQPPVVLVQVSYITATITRPAVAAVQFATGLPYAAPQPNPAAPTVKATPIFIPQAYNPSISTVSTGTTTVYSSATSSTTSSDSAPPDDETSIDGIIFEGGAPPAPIKQPLPPTVEPLLPAITESGILVAASLPILPLPTTSAIPQATNNRKPNPTHTSLTTTPPAASPPLSTLPLLPGAPAITLSGTTFSLSPSSSVLLLNSNPLLPGAPPVTISGTTYSLASPPTALIIGTSPSPTPIININNNINLNTNTTLNPPTSPSPSSASETTLALPPPLNPSSTLPFNPALNPAAAGASASQPPTALITAGAILVPAGGPNTYLVNWTPLIPGGAPITVNGQKISLQSGATGVVVGTKTAAVTGSGVGALGTGLGDAGLSGGNGGGGNGDGGNGGNGGSGGGFTNGAGGRGREDVLGGLGGAIVMALVVSMGVEFWC